MSALTTIWLLFVVACCSRLSGVGAQNLTTLISVNDLAPGAPYDGYGGDTINVTCQFFLDLASFGTLRFQVDVGSGTVDVEVNSDGTSDVTLSGSLTGLNVSSFLTSYALSTTSQSYTVRLESMRPEQSGNYSCAVEDSSNTLGPYDSVMVTIQDPCLADPCFNNATSCTDIDDSRDYSCACRDGYTGKSCETDIDECATNPCENFGTCEDLVGRYFCQCTPCTNGTDCEDLLIDPCDSNRCQNGATCQNRCQDVDDYECVCPSGFEGTYCNTRVTTPTPGCNLVRSITPAERYLLNTDVQLSCEPTVPSHSVAWSLQQDGAPILQSGGVLDLGRVGPSDDRRYYCVVRDGICEDIRTSRVTVYWEMTPNTTEVTNSTWKKGSKKTLSCSVTSDPTATVSWRFTPSEEEMNDDEPVANATTAAPRVTSVTLNGTTENGTTSVTVAKVSKDDQGVYECVAQFPRGVVEVAQRHNIKVVKGGLPWWAILLIVLACLIVVGVVVFLIVYCCCIKKGSKVGNVCGGDKSGGVEVNANKAPTQKSAPKTTTGETKVSYKSETARSEGGEDRPLPYMPDKGRGGVALAPLDVEAERANLHKKKKKRRTTRDPDAADDDGGYQDGGDDAGAMSS